MTRFIFFRVVVHRVWLWNHLGHDHSATYLSAWAENIYPELRWWEPLVLQIHTHHFALPVWLWVYGLLRRWLSRRRRDKISAASAGLRQERTRPLLWNLEAWARFLKEGGHDADHLA